MHKDKLITGATRAHLTGSYKTRANDMFGIRRFVETIRVEGQGVQKWSNLHKGHIAAAVTSWQQSGLSSATIKNYLSSVRKVCTAYGNQKIANTTNKDFGISSRVYVTNQDKSVPDHVYRNAVSALSKGNSHQQAVGLIIEVARTYGTRLEESYKFCPKDDVSPYGAVTISRGTKGGRERTFILSQEQKQLAERVKTFSANKGNLIPEGWSERSWRQYVYRQAREAGLSRQRCGASFHGLRHARLQELYTEITGFLPPVKYDNKQEFIESAREIAGDKWQELDTYANTLVTLQAGHGAGRHIYKQYLGSWK